MAGEFVPIGAGARRTLQREPAGLPAGRRKTANDGCDETMTSAAAEGRSPIMNIIADVRSVVIAIPAGRVASYGDVGALIGAGPRQVGRVMSLLDDGIPWWRVVHADGTPASCHGGTARGLLSDEGTPMRGTRVDMRRARIDASGMRKPGSPLVAERAATGLLVADVMVRFPKTHGPDARLADIRELFADDHVHMAVIVAPGGRLLTAIERHDLTADLPASTPAGTLGTLTGRTAGPADPLAPVTETLLRRHRRRLAVTDGSGRLLGLLCLKRDGSGYCSDDGVRERAGSAPAREFRGYPGDVSGAAFDTRLARLVASLDATVTLLRDHRETRWLTWASRCRNELANHDAAAFDHVLGAFGGMGSLNDLQILARNGHDIRPDEEGRVNERLARLRHLIWDDATTLRHRLRGSTPA